MSPEPGIEELQQRFSQLIAEGVLIPDPQSPVECYANARLCEFAGDFASARTQYLGFFRHPCECLDPHLRYLQILEPQLGKAEALQAYLQLTANATQPKISRLVNALFGELDRTAQLEALLKQFPECGPVAYFLSSQYSATEMGVRSLKQKNQEKSLLDYFQQLDQKGKVANWFFEPEFVADWRSDVSMRQSDLASIAYLFENPVDLRWNEKSDGWMGTILVSEIALELLWKPKQETELRSTGTLGTRRYSTGHHHPRPHFEIPKTNAFTEIEIYYRDISEEIIGPFNFGLDPASQDILSCKQLLNATRSGWASFRRQDDDRVTLHFTHLFKYKKSLKTIKYGVDNRAPEKELDLSARKTTGIARLDQKMPIFVELPNSTKNVTIEVEFQDGDRSTGIVRSPF